MLHVLISVQVRGGQLNCQKQDTPHGATHAHTTAASQLPAIERTTCIQYNLSYRYCHHLHLLIVNVFLVYYFGNKKINLLIDETALIFNFLILFFPDLYQNHKI